MIRIFIVAVLLTACLAPNHRAFQSPLDQHNIYFPVAGSGGCGWSIEAQEFYDLLMDDPRQQRESLTCNPLLINAANNRAIATSKLWAHYDIYGVWANEYVRRSGCRLGHEFNDRNQVESLVAGTGDAVVAKAVLSNSPSHAIHIFGEIDFFRQQKEIGIAMVEIPGSPYQFYWSIIIANCAK